MSQLINFIPLQSTTHTYTVGGYASTSGASSSIDESFATAWSVGYYDQLFDRNQGSGSVYRYSEHYFSTSHTILQIKYMVAGHAHGDGDYGGNGSYNWGVQYQQGTTTWVDFSGHTASSSGGNINFNTGEVTATVSVLNVTAVRLWVGCGGNGSDHGGAAANNAIYEIQAFGEASSGYALIF